MTVDKLYQHHHAQTDVYQELHAPIRDVYADDEEEGSGGEPKTSVWQAVFSYLCTCVGAGVLSLPGALRYCGWMGLVLTAFIALLCNLTANYLVGCMFARPGALLRTYEDIGELAMGKWGRRMVAFFQTIKLFGVCTVFLILIGNNMTTLVPKLTMHAWVFIFAGLLIPIAWLKTMREVSYLAFFGVAASLYVAGVVIVKGFMRCAEPEEGADAIHYDIIRGQGIPNAINIIAFSLNGHSVLPNIVTHLKNPQQNYKKVTGYAYLIIALIYMVTAAGGYAGWGTDSKDNMLDNMNENSPVVKAAYAFITAHIVMAYPIPLNPVSLALESLLGIDKKTGTAELVSRVISRTCLVLLTVLIASCVPYFGDILSLVSALSIVVVAFVFPPLFYYLLYRHRGFTAWEIAVMTFIVVFGIGSSGIGIYYAIKDLINSIQSNPNPFDHYF